jgi:chromosome segregation ATPase
MKLTEHFQFHDLSPMPIFTKSRFKRRANGTATRSLWDLGGNNRSLARISPDTTRAEDGDALVQDFLSVIEAQTTEINQLKHELNLRESALDDCLRQVDKPRSETGSQGNELQQKAQELGLLKSQLQKQDRLFQEHIQNGQEELQSAHKDFEMQLTQQLDQHASVVKRLKHQLCEEKSKFEWIQARLEEELVQARQIYKEQLEAVRKEAQYSEQKARACWQEKLVQERANSDVARTAQLRAQEVARRLEEQLNEKGRRIHELSDQLQTETETIEETRLSLNRTRNELNEEKRKARQAIGESATKGQQLEFVQQQCAKLQEQLLKRNFYTVWPNDPFWGFEFSGEYQNKQ